MDMEGALIIRGIAMLAISSMDKEISMAYTFGKMEIFMTGSGKLIIKMGMEHFITMHLASHILAFGRKIKYII